MKQPAAHLLASSRNGTLYTGVTSNLVQRAWQQREHLAPGFTDENNVTMRAYYERHACMEAAITREGYP